MRSRDDQVQVFETREAARTVATAIGDARELPVVDADREPVGYVVEHRSGAARLSVAGEWISP